MIPLSTCSYYLDGVSENFFWKELNKITIGQSIDPNFGFDIPLAQKSQKIFIGRREDHKFSIFLNRQTALIPVTRLLAKGAVLQKGAGLMIHCRFTYPILSLILFITFGAAFLIEIFHSSIPTFFTVSLIVSVLYLLLILHNYSKIKHEVARQLEIIEQKARAERTKMQFI